MTQVFTGLYPQIKGVPSFHLRLVNHENLYPNDNECAYPSPPQRPTPNTQRPTTPLPPIHFAFVALVDGELNCRLLKKLTEVYSVNAGREWDPKLKESSQALKRWIPDGVTVNGRPKATGLLDTITASLANGVELPAQLMDEKLRRDLESAAVAEWFSGYLGNTSTSFPFFSISEVPAAC